MVLPKKYWMWSITVLKMKIGARGLVLQPIKVILWVKPFNWLNLFSYLGDDCDDKKRLQCKIHWIDIVAEAKHELYKKRDICPCLPARNFRTDAGQIISWALRENLTRGEAWKRSRDRCHSTIALGKYVEKSTFYYYAEDKFGKQTDNFPCLMLWP